MFPNLGTEFPTSWLSTGITCRRTPPLERHGCSLRRHISAHKNLAPKKIRLDVFLLCSTFSGIMEKALDKWWPGCKLLSDSYFPLWDVFGWEETQDDSWKMVTSFAWCSHFLGTFLGDSGPGGVHPNWPCYLEHFGGVFQSNGSSKAHSAIATHGYIKFKWCWKMI